MHTNMNALQVSTHLHARTSRFHAVVCRLTYKWRNYSWSPQCALILIFPACWIYLLNLSLSSCCRQRLLWHMMPRSVIEKNEQSLITPDPKTIFLLKRMQYKCCNNITDNRFLKVRIQGNNAAMSLSGLIAPILYCHNNASCSKASAGYQHSSSLQIQISVSPPHGTITTKQAATAF